MAACSTCRIDVLDEFSNVIVECKAEMKGKTNQILPFKDLV